MTSIEDDVFDHEEEVLRDFNHESWESSELEHNTEEPECDNNMIFVLMLKDNKVLLSKSQAPSVKVEKRKSIVKVLKMYQELFGEELTVTQLYSKINVMKADVRKKFSVKLDSTGSKKIVLCKPWEKLFQELIVNSNMNSMGSNNYPESYSIQSYGETFDHEEEEPRILQQEDSTLCEISHKTDESHCDKTLEFVRMLEGHKVLFSKSMTPAVRNEKRKCVVKVKKLYKETFGEELSVKQLFKKINNMKSRARRNVYEKTAEHRQDTLKPWELLLNKIISTNNSETNKSPAVITSSVDEADECEMLDEDEEEIPENLCQENDRKEDDQDCDKNLMFLLMLKDNKILFSKYQTSIIQEEKEKCALKVLNMYREAFEKELTPKQLFKKISNMKTKVKRKFELSLTENKYLKIKPWEKFLIEMIDEDENSTFTKTEATISTLKRSKAQSPDLCASPLMSLGSLSASSSDFIEPETSSQHMNEPNKHKKSKIDLNETEETRHLTNSELERLLLLEQLKLVRLKLQRELLCKQTNTQVANEANSPPVACLFEQ